MTKTLFVLLIGSAALFSCKHKPDDAAIKAAVDKQVQGNPALSGITTEVKEGTVTVSGVYADAALKGTTDAMIKGVEGVKDVADNATVAPPAPAPAAVAAPPVDVMAQAVNDAIKDFPGVQASVADGVITVSGEIKRAVLPRLMQALNSLHPTKIVNNLTVQK